MTATIDFPPVAWPEAGRVGSVAEEKRSRTFQVQAVWAYPHEPEGHDHLRWSSYCAHAYRDRGTGKPFSLAHPDIAKHADRVNVSGDPSWDFSTLAAATACMDLLAVHAEWASDYETNADWAIPRRGRPIIFRVVEIDFARTVRVAA